jgi:phosphoribosyl-ATP pyrophosphohydrolase/phosphoribosyl-AMP cyclohydrolase
MMDFGKLDGLIPAVVQDNTSNEVLMVGFMNEQAWQLTQASGYVTFFSRTRQTLWTKGETSGNRLAVRQLFVDCDEDTVLIKADREGDGNVCHTGARTCFAPLGQVGQAGRVRQVGDVGQVGKAKR